MKFELDDAQARLVQNALVMAKRECSDLGMQCERDMVWAKHMGRREEADRQREVMVSAREAAAEYDAVLRAIQDQQ